MNIALRSAYYPQLRWIRMIGSQRIILFRENKNIDILTHVDDQRLSHSCRLFLKVDLFHALPAMYTVMGS